MGSWWESLGRRGVGARIQPVEIAKKLVREMSAHKKVSVKKVYVPNCYVIFLGPLDWDLLSPVEQSLSSELSNYLEEKAKEREYTLVGRPRVGLELDEKLQEGEIRVVSRFAEEEKVEKAEKSAPQSTMPLNLAPRFSLRVVKGPDSGLDVSLDQPEITIGRRSTCQVALTDANISRQHAVIQSRNGSLWIQDLGSTNGTYVNGERVDRVPLRQGDRIVLGDSELEIEAL